MCTSEMFYDCATSLISIFCVGLTSLLMMCHTSYSLYSWNRCYIKKTFLRYKNLSTYVISTIDMITYILKIEYIWYHCLYISYIFYLYIKDMEEILERETRRKEKTEKRHQSHFYFFVVWREISNSFCARSDPGGTDINFFVNKFFILMHGS